MLTTISRSALVMHSAENMYDLVNDVVSYPEYMEGCDGAEILEQGEGFMIARLHLRKGGVSYSFTTRNTLSPHGEIRLELHAGPFRHLAGVWTFRALTEAACKVSLYLEFETGSQLASVAASSLFSSVANNLVTALSQRADVMYGKK